LILSDLGVPFGAKKSLKNNLQKRYPKKATKKLDHLETLVFDALAYVKHQIAFFRGPFIKVFLPRFGSLSGTPFNDF
jgi:hypothetical protein